MQWTIDVSPALDAQSRWREIVAIDLTFTTLMVIVVSLRFWYKRRKLAIEDGILAFSAITSLAFNVACIVQTRYGYGLPPPLRAPSQTIPFHLLNYPFRPISALSLMGFKLALCISYLHLLDGTNKWKYRWFIIGLAIFSVSGHVTVALLFILQCLPVYKNIDPTYPGSCLNYAPVSYLFSAVSIVSDVFIFLLPVPLVLRMNTDRPTKIGLCLVFSLGLCTTVLTILRTTQVPVIGAGSGDSTLFGLYAAVETNVGVITASLPVLRPMIIDAHKRIVNKVVTKRSRGSADHSYGGSNEGSRQDSSASRKFLDRFSMNKSDVKVTTTDGESEEIMLETAEQSYQPSNRWGDLSIVKTVDYSVETRQDKSEMEKRSGGCRELSQW